MGINFQNTSVQWQKNMYVYTGTCHHGNGKW